MTNDIVIRHRSRKGTVTAGVTEEMVIDVIKLTYEEYRQEDFPDWPEFCVVPAGTRDSGLSTSPTPLMISAASARPRKKFAQ